MSKYGLTQERYEQLMFYYNNDEESVKQIVEDWTADICNKGYDIFNYDCTGLLEIERIDEVYAFVDDYQASLQAEKDGIKILRGKRLEKLNKILPKYLQIGHNWIDSEENIHNLIAYGIRHI